MTAHAHGVSTQPVVESDESLVQRLRDGDTHAGQVLVERHCQALMRYLRRLSGSDQLAEELHQQTWLSVLDHIDRFSSRSVDGGFRAWLFRIATNKANDYWRSQGRERAAKQGMALVVDQQDRQAGHRLEATEEAIRLRRAIDALPENQKQVVLMRYYSGMKFVQIAQVLGCPLNTALGRMHKAMLKLKQLMEA
jgi:RNA polymerase sigma-70 factor (ECF subfamily)